MDRDVSSNTNRGADMSREQIIANFLDEYLYPEITEDTERRNRATSDDVADQLKGIDLTATIPEVGVGCKVDEKAQIDYLNEPVPSFVLELNAFNRANRLQRGWFFDDSYETEYYLFVWIPDCITFELTDADDIIVRYNPDSTDKLIVSIDEKLDGFLGEKRLPNGPKIQALLTELTGDLPAEIETGSAQAEIEYFCSKHLREARCLLIERTAIQNYLADEGYTEEDFEERAREIRDTGETGFIREDHPAFDYFVSDHKGESPLNIRMKYAPLHTLATETYIASREGVVRGQRLF